MSTLHQFPVQRNQPPAAPEEVADALGVAIDAAVGADASFEAREAAALALTNEATRLFLERELLAIADGHGTHVEGDGVIYQRHEPGIVRYFTLCGAVDIGCLCRSLLIRQPFVVRTATRTSAARLCEVLCAGRSRECARPPQSNVERDRAP